MTAEIIQFNEPGIKIQCSFCKITYTKKSAFNGFSNLDKHICHNCLIKCKELKDK